MVGFSNCLCGKSQTSPPCEHHVVRSFPYIKAALKEALRVFPTAPTLVRETTRAVSLGGYSLAKGQVVAVSVYSMHHNQAYWDVRPSLPLSTDQHLHKLQRVATCSLPKLVIPTRTPKGTCQNVS